MPYKQKWSNILSRLRFLKRLQNVENLILNAQAATEQTNKTNREILDLIRVIDGKTPNMNEDSYDLREVSTLRAAFSSSQFFDENMREAAHFFTLKEFLEHCVSQTSHKDVFLEFGVYSGRSVNIIADCAPGSDVVGFDSFEGLPETWRSGFQQGMFAIPELPKVRPNVELIKGWFDDTLPAFAENLKTPVGFVHIDCDLYSSTKTIFDILGPRFADETIVVFDEYFNYPGWELHEHKAFTEFLEHSNYEHEFIACIPNHQQVAARLRRKT